jgi:hypothetical protein
MIFLYYPLLLTNLILSMKLAFYHFDEGEIQLSYSSYVISPIEMTKIKTLVLVIDIVLLIFLL